MRADKYVNHKTKKVDKILDSCGKLLRTKFAQELHFVYYVERKPFLTPMTTPSSFVLCGLLYEPLTQSSVI